MIKKRISCVCLFVFALCMVGCNQTDEFVQICNLSSTNKIVIQEFDLASGELVHNVTVENEEEISFICDNFSSLSLRRMKGRNKPIDIKYHLVFYNNDNEVEIIGLSTNGWVDYDGHFYTVESGEIAFEYIDSLLQNDKTLGFYLSAFNPDSILLYGKDDGEEKSSAYFNFEVQPFIIKFSQIEVKVLDSNEKYDMDEVDYYITFSKIGKNDYMRLEFYHVIDSDNDTYYGMLKTNYLNEIFEFNISKDLFNEIYNYLTDSTEYYVLENAISKNLSNYSVEKIINLIRSSQKIEFNKDIINELQFDLEVSTVKPSHGVYPVDIYKFNYVWRVDYETRIAEMITFSPPLSSQLYLNQYFQLNEETVKEVKDILTGQSYELISDDELLSFYHETMFINTVEGFPFIVSNLGLASTEKLASVHKRYDEDFFKEYTLMIIRFDTSSTEEIKGIDDIIFDGNQFTVIFDMIPGITDDLVYKYFVLKIKKSTLPPLDKASYEVDIKVNNLLNPNEGSPYYDKYTE